MIEVKDLQKRFDLGGGKLLSAVDGISLNIEKNTIVGLVGESGSGKSTLGKTVVGLYDKTGGSVSLDGEILPTAYSAKDFQRYGLRMQMIFQDPYASLNPRMTVEEILVEPLKLQGKHSADECRTLAEDWLKRVNLHPSHLGRYPHEFSGGQRQRIGIARALITEPDFVVCDEPISALDVSVQAQVVNLLSELQKSMGLTLLFIAHDLSMVRYISDEMVVMYLGNVVEQGPADQVFFNPQHPYTKVLIESNPVADPRQEKQRASQSIKGEIPSPVNLPPGCAFAGRCPDASQRCREEKPRLQTVADKREVACHLFDEA